jgi:hypothetical protein
MSAPPLSIISYSKIKHATKLGHTYVYREVLMVAYRIGRSLVGAFGPRNM